MRHFIPQSVVEHIYTHNVWHGMPHTIALALFVSALVMFVTWYCTRSTCTKVDNKPTKHPLD